MLEITLLKTLFHEMDEDKIKEIKVYDNDQASKYHELNVSLPEFPDIHTMTCEVRYMAYGVAMYYLHFNKNLEVDEDIHSEEAKAFIYDFFKTYRPDFLKADLPSDLTDISILDCFDLANIPDYRPKYAFPGIVMLEDIKNGTAKLPDGSMPTFPGIRMLGRNKEEKEDDRPVTVSKKDNVTKFDGDRDDFAKKMEELKSQFNVDALLNK